MSIVTQSTGMPRRRLGSSGLIIPALGLGCMGMSEFYGPADDEESIRVIHRSIELGMNFLDTADVYGLGRNEELVGRAIAGRRDKVIVATKFGNVRGPDGAFIAINGKASYVKSACEASLKRLNIDYIDLYYQHRVDPKTPIEETVTAMADLVRDGKVRFLGLSEAAPTTIKRAVRTHRIAALQSEYSLWTRDIEDKILPMCRSLGVGFVAYSPLGRGFLGGKFKSKSDLEVEKDYRKNSPRFQGEHFDHNLKLLEKIEAIAARNNCTPAQVSLAWLLSRGEDLCAIPGTKHINYLEQNAAAVNLNLTRQELQGLERLLPVGSAAGPRYPEQAMTHIDTDEKHIGENF